MQNAFKDSRLLENLILLYFNLKSAANISRHFWTRGKEWQ